MSNLRLGLLPLLAACLLCPAIHGGEIELIGTLAIPANARDLSGLTDRLEGGVPQNQFGGLSAIASTSQKNRYLLLPDRGPADGAVPYLCRFHEVELTVHPQATPPLSYRLLATHRLTNEAGQSFNGSSRIFHPDSPEQSLRLDPEGIRSAADGTVYISEEYGPEVFQFSPTGQLLRRLNVPAHLKIGQPAADKDDERALNRTGRQPNRGFEGLTFSPDGKKLYAILQGPLLQDHPLDSAGKKWGRNVRLTEFDLDSEQTREFVYVLDDPGFTISEVLALDAERLIFLERDGKQGSKSQAKKLTVANLSGASDVSGIASLPAVGLPSGLQPMSKQPLLDLLDPRFGLNRDEIPEKIEGLAFGPDLPDGRKLLWVCADNDFSFEQPSLIYAFAIPQN